MSLSTNDLAWVAGLFDGEGSVGFYRRSDKRNKTGSAYYIVASIHMTHAPTIQRIANMFPGVRWSAYHKNVKHRTCFCWRLYNAKARAFLNEILPYTFTKAEEIRKALAADAIRQQIAGELGQHRSLTKQDMAELDTHVSALKLLKRVEHG